MTSKLRCAIAQMCSTDDIDKNTDQVLDLLNSVQGTVDVAFFPENSLFFRIDPKAKMTGIGWEHPLWNRLQKQVDLQGFPIFLGSFAFNPGDGKLVNATGFLQPGRKPEIVYSKMHLFDVDVVGQAPIRESDVFGNGERPSIIDVCGWKIGLSICYDVRFSELFAHYRLEGVDAIVVPAAFLKKTGQAHWHILLRARAIESQCFVIASAQSGGHKGAGGLERETFGHSLVVDPWGEVLLDAGTEAPKMEIVEVELDRLKKVRSQIPMSAHRHVFFKK